MCRVEASEQLGLRDNKALDCAVLEPPKLFLRGYIADEFGVQPCEQSTQMGCKM